MFFSLLIFSTSLYAKEAKGAELIVKRSDGRRVEGELIAVKEDSLLILDSESGCDISVPVSEINTVTIVKRLKTVLWGGIGALAGVTVGAAVGAASYNPRKDVLIIFTKGESIAIGAATFGFLGLVIGTVVGAISGIDKTIHMEGKSESETEETMEYLRAKARVTNYQ